MLQGLMAAEVLDGPFKGWPLGAAMAVENGQGVEDVRALLIADLEADKRRIDDEIKAIVALPAPAVASAIVGAGALSTSEFVKPE